ncbi:MAG: response regulator [Deltaproteobacteria bacterium]|nr:response regulator [Deltaproteobacteria bacterium]
MGLRRRLSEVRPRILIVDDDARVRSSLALVLSDLYETLEASSGTEAIGVIENSDVRAVLSDLFMPNGSGIELGAWIETHRNDLVPRFFVLSGGAVSVESEVFLKSLGPRALNKPIDPRELREKLQQAVGIAEANIAAAPSAVERAAAPSAVEPAVEAESASVAPSPLAEQLSALVRGLAEPDRTTLLDFVRQLVHDLTTPIATLTLAARSIALEERNLDAETKVDPSRAARLGRLARARRNVEGATDRTSEIVRLLDETTRSDE